MPSTTIHFPPEILKRMDEVAQRRGISRNKLVIRACEKELADDAGEWPSGFFELDMSDRDRSILREAGIELENAVLRSRTNRGAPLF